MSGVEIRAVGEADADIRLDRWFRRHFPGLAHGRLEKLLRTGQVRVDGKRAKAGQRVLAGQEIRIPPLPDTPPPEPKKAAAPRPEDAEFLRSLILFEDPQVIVVNKPAGLPVQGGTRSQRNLDAMLPALAGRGGERPRLVHRLDRDTSGALLLARTARAAAALGRQFRGREALKLYWALVAGRPEVRRGRIDLPLAKRAGAGGERMVPVGDADGRAEDAKRAITDFAEVDHAGNRLAWLALMPQTGRTHQLRVHCAAIGTPIAGDGKYGGRDAFVDGAGLDKKVHLHARRLRLPHPGGGWIDVTAPLPPHMAAAWKGLNFDLNDDGDPFELEDGNG